MLILSRGDVMNNIREMAIEAIRPEVTTQHQMVSDAIDVAFHHHASLDAWLPFYGGEEYNLLFDRALNTRGWEDFNLYCLEVLGAFNGACCNV